MTYEDRAHAVPGVELLARSLQCHSPGVSLLVLFAAGRGRRASRRSARHGLDSHRTIWPGGAGTPSRSSSIAGSTRMNACSGSTTDVVLRDDSCAAWARYAPDAPRGWAGIPGHGRLGQRIARAGFRPHRPHAPSPTRSIRVRSSADRVAPASVSPLARASRKRRLSRGAASPVRDRPVARRRGSGCALGAAGLRRI